jgi:hypothetical protein
MDGLQDEEWLHYSYVGHTETWKVVLLSLNINPKFAELEKDHYAYFSETAIKKIGLDRRKYSGNVTESQIKERYEIIEKRKYDGDYVYDDFTVDVEKFVKFANKLHLKPFPEKFLKLFQTKDDSTFDAVENIKRTVFRKEPRPKKPIRARDYNNTLYETVKILCEKNNAIPTGYDVIKIWKNEKPDTIFEVLNKSFKYLDEDGNVIEVGMANLNKAVNRLFEN